MAFTLCTRVATPLLSSSALRRRLPLVGAFCVLSFGFSNFFISKTGSALSLPFAPLLRYFFSLFWFISWCLLLWFRFSYRLICLCYLLETYSCWIANGKRMSDRSLVVKDQLGTYIWLKWKGVVPRCLALLSMSLFLIGKQVFYYLLIFVHLNSLVICAFVQLWSEYSSYFSRYIVCFGVSVSCERR